MSIKKNCPKCLLKTCRCANEGIECLNCANSDHDEHCISSLRYIKPKPFNTEKFIKQAETISSPDNWEEAFLHDFGEGYPEWNKDEGRANSYWSTEKVKQIKQFIRDQISAVRERERERLLQDIHDNLGYLASDGHGGGNWRRLVLQLQEHYLELLQEKKEE